MNKNKRNGNNSASPILETKSVAYLQSKTGNLYESIVVIAKRANQISSTLKEELHGKLEEFATTTDNLEEIHENREQIEISKHYEKMPDATLIATQEFMDDKVYFRNPAKEEQAEA
ncbi:MAG: DNA-directed RNA polymerase subunit omega [Chitinophagales bacterium]|jgi:DNA-directed RNA polymerase subunit K/omega|nr:DNA-directed RNA polymerase subunit omega [Chitinophagales bacterium]